MLVQISPTSDEQAMRPRSNETANLYLVERSDKLGMSPGSARRIKDLKRTDGADSGMVAVLPNTKNRT